jgi:outer membrane protein
MMVFAATAQPWSLERCIQYAYENNLDIKQQQLESNISQTDVEVAKYSLLPDLNAGAGYNYNFGRSLDPFLNEIVTDPSTSNNFYVQSQVSLFEGLRKYHNLAYREYRLKMTEAELEKAKNDISIQIAMAYLQILFNKELLQVAQSQDSLIQMQLERTKALVEVGNVAKGDLYEIQAQAANEKYNVTNAQNELNIAYLDLVQLLDLEDTDNFEIVIPEIAVQEHNRLLQPVSELYQTSLGIMPQVKSAEWRVKSADKNVEIQKSGFRPSLYASFRISTGYSSLRTLPNENTGVTEDYPYFDQIEDNQDGNVSVGLQIPIFNRFENRASVNRARMYSKQAELSLEKTKLQLYKDIQQVYADGQAALDRYYAAQEAVKFNEEAFSYAQQKYDVGMITAVEYNTAKNNLIKAKSDSLQAKFEYVFQLKLIDFYLGNQLSLN